MTPKEKADELIRKMTVDFSIEFEQSKLCALIAVDEILNNCLFEIYYSCGFLTLETKHKEYWQEVKQEINKL